MKDVKPGGVLEPPGRNNMALKNLLIVMRQRIMEISANGALICGGLSNRQRHEFEAGFLVPVPVPVSVPVPGPGLVDIP